MLYVNSFIFILAGLIPDRPTKKPVAMAGFKEPFLKMEVNFLKLGNHIDDSVD